jgi:hypothetical protein
VNAKLLNLAAPSEGAFTRIAIAPATSASVREDRQEQRRSTRGFRRDILAIVMLAVALAWSGAATAQTAANKPNILVIWGDDIGVHNISAYNHGIMGYRTPNIDRIANEGALFTDSYAQQSCTAGRASFILGQHPFRTGLLTVGFPGSPHGIPD